VCKGESHSLDIAEAGVKRVIKVPLNVWQMAALIDFVFNLGEAALRSSAMARLFNAGDYAGGCEELARWGEGQGARRTRDALGLVARGGVEEEELCLGWK
jgi:lysozyme